MTDLGPTRGIRVHEKTRPVPTFCRHCGARLIADRRPGQYDRDTGEPRWIPRLRCPRRAGLLHWLTLGLASMECDYYEQFGGWWMET